MYRSVFIALALMFIVIVGSGLAATPQQVGFYSGSLKVQYYEPTGIRSQKYVMFVNIAANDDTTVTLNGEQQVWSAGTAQYGPTEGIFIWQTPGFEFGSSAYYTTAHFTKPNQLFGSLTATELDATGPTPILLRNGVGKYKLKKLP